MNSLTAHLKTRQHPHPTGTEITLYWKNMPKSRYIIQKWDYKTSQQVTLWPATGTGLKT